ncbi:MAG: beta-N-acetylhexosaminidase [Pseudomonadota bacterium]
MAIGPVMVDLKSTELSDDDIRRLSHPLVGGVILFTRNYRSPKQLGELIKAIRAIKTSPLLIAVDHEGGRVQRFRDGFTRLPPMRKLGNIWDRDPRRARKLAREIGYILGAELRAYGVDFSFTPVLDIDFGESGVIGDRAFHRDPQAIGDLAHGLQLGLRDAGMSTVGKHYPGHGYVRADSHTDVPVDEREFVDIELTDLIPFRQMVNYGMTAVMPAHVIYPKVDKKPAGFSKVWLQEILRKQMRFEGVIFSDDLSMEGARTEGGIVARGESALNAGCDMVLVCNNPDAADELLSGLKWNIQPASVVRLTRMRGGPHSLSESQLWETARYRSAITEIGLLAGAQRELALGPDPTAPRG